MQYLIKDLSTKPEPTPKKGDLMVRYHLAGTISYILFLTGDMDTQYERAYATLIYINPTGPEAGMDPVGTNRIFGMEGVILFKGELTLIAP